MSDPHCHKDFIITLTITDIENFHVKFDGDTIPYSDYSLGGDQYQITVSGASLTSAGTLTYFDGATLIETKTVLCP